MGEAERSHLFRVRIVRDTDRGNRHLIHSLIFRMPFEKGRNDKRLIKYDVYRISVSIIRKLLYGSRIL